MTTFFAVSVKLLIVMFPNTILNFSRMIAMLSLNSMEETRADIILKGKVLENFLLYAFVEGYRILIRVCILC